MVFSWVRGYQRAWLRPDLSAGVLIVALAIPLSMGMAEVAGMPPVAGLYTCILPLVAWAAFARSRFTVLGLDASTAAMIAAAVTPLAGNDPGRYAALVGGLTLLVGAIIVIAGVARLGVVGDLLGEPVLLGYQAGLALVVLLGQIPRMLGIKVSADDAWGRLVGIVENLDASNATTLALATACLVAVLALRRWNPRFPGALAVLVVATLVVEFADLDARGVAVVGDLPSGFPPLGWPGVSPADLVSLLGAALAIAVVATADTLVTSRSFAARHRDPVDDNRDLVGLGAANLASGLSGGLCASASVARTAVAESVGVRTPAASLTAGVLMALVVAFATGLLRAVPQAALAAVVVAAVLRLIDVRGFRRLWRVRRTEFAVAVTCMVVVLAVGVLPGILVAVGLAVLDFFRRAADPYDCELGRVAGRAGWYDAERTEGATTIDGLVLYRFDGPLFFANANRFRQRLRTLGERPGVEWVVVDASAIADVDATAAAVLADTVAELDGAGVRVSLADVERTVAGQLERYGLAERLGGDGAFATLDEAVAAFEQRTPAPRGRAPDPEGGPPSEPASGR